jgi:hypothetical protein
MQEKQTEQQIQTPQTKTKKVKPTESQSTTFDKSCVPNIDKVPTDVLVEYQKIYNQIGQLKQEPSTELFDAVLRCLEIQLEEQASLICHHLRK